MIQNEGHNFEGIRRMMAMAPCWKIRGCAKEDWEFCLARRVKNKPCWTTEQRCNCKLSSCRDCQVYQNIIDSEDIYGFINS
jgi:MerR family transcriptional regulator, heat shock protein HspR